jgi:hypothetical protein
MGVINMSGSGVAKGKEKRASGAANRPSVPPWQETMAMMLAGQAEVDEADVVAIEMERKWGRDRLRLMVTPELRERFDRQRYNFNRAIWHGTLPELVEQSRRMAKAWRALDKAAEEAGREPIDPLVWEVSLAKSGDVIAIVRDGDGSRVSPDGRRLRVYELSEIARLIEAFPEVVRVKEMFPGAEVAAARGQIGDPLDAVRDAKRGLEEPIDWSVGDSMGF